MTTAQLTITGRKIPLDEELASALPAEARDIWREFKPSGESDTTIRLICGKEGDPSSLDYVVSIEPQGKAAVEYSGFPYPFGNLTGQVLVTPRRVQFVNLTASQSGQKVKGQLWARLNWILDFANGRTEGGPGSGDPKNPPVLEVYALPVNQKLRDSLPKDVSSLFHHMDDKGKADLVLDRMHVVRSPRAGSSRPAATQPASRPAAGGLWAWDVAGEIVLNGVSLDIGLGNKTLNGRFTGGVNSSPKGTGVDATIALKSMAVGEQELTEVEGRLVKRPESNIVNISNFSGQVYGGVVSGNVDIRTGEEITYGVRLDVSRVQLAKLFHASAASAPAPAPAPPATIDKPVEPGEIKGLLEGRLELVATSGKPERTKASGEIRITQAHMFKLPVMLELLHVVYLTPPGGGAFNDGRMSYQLKGNQLIFTEISLRGNALSVLGSGTVEMDTKKMNMAFISGPPPQAGLLRLDEAGPILKGLARELMEVQVTGTLDRPQMRPVPWTSLDAILRKLMNPEKEK
ncbi:MAG: hypothetical protein NT031_20190 [Planctomycetota bacterium]|nr:hypothetical protein [Planctomycetota bacterium]